MTEYEYILKAYEILTQSFNEKRWEYINNHPGLKEILYCTFVTFVGKFLAKHKWYRDWIDELSTTDKSISYSEILHDIIKNSTGIGLTKEICEKVIIYLKENENKIKKYEENQNEN